MAASKQRRKTSSPDAPRKSGRSSLSAGSSPLRIGFVDLVDAAPLVVALEKGFFRDQGVQVTLHRQLGWGSIRDRLTFGQLDAAHALVGMPLFSNLGRDWFVEPLVAVMNLGTGGNAITLSRRLIDAGVKSAATLGEYIRNDPRAEVLVFGHVFSCSMHHYLLREWLASAGINPDRDVRLRVFPPNQLAGHMSRGHVDGMCVGEPWNTIAEECGAGRMVAVTTDVLPRHPEKVLALTRRGMRANQQLLAPLIRAVLQACAFCEDEHNHEELAEILSRAEYLNLSREIICKSLELDHIEAHKPGRSTLRASDWRVRSFAPATTFPSRAHSEWIASQMIRWGQLSADIDIDKIARRCADATAYVEAAGSLGIECPAEPTDNVLSHREQSQNHSTRLLASSARNFI